MVVVVVVVEEVVVVDVVVVLVVVLVLVVVGLGAKQQNFTWASEQSPSITRSHFTPIVDGMRDLLINPLVVSNDRSPALVELQTDSATAIFSKFIKPSLGAPIQMVSTVSQSSSTSSLL